MLRNGDEPELSGRYTPFILAPLGGFSGPSANSQQHFIFGIMAAVVAVVAYFITNTL